MPDKQHTSAKVQKEEQEPLQKKEILTSDVVSNEENEHGWTVSLGVFFLEVIKIAVLAGITIGLVRYFLFKPFYVQGQSMQPTYFQNEYLIVDELTYDFRAPERGEVIVFHPPVDPSQFYIKRVIGLPGERIEVHDGKIIIYNKKHPQGIVLTEPYEAQSTSGNRTWTLNSNQYFMMGDNRGESYDSRSFGPVKRSAIVGRVIFRGWPMSRITTFSVPNYNF